MSKYFKIANTIGSQSFEYLTKIDDFGIVVTGAGGPLKDWYDGICEVLNEEGIISELDADKVWKEAFSISDNIKGESGRKDLVLIFNDDIKPNVGKMAMWRLRFGDVKWIEDFINNNAKEFRSGTFLGKDEEYDEE